MMLTSIPLTSLDTGGAEQQPSSGASEPLREPSSLKVGNRVSFVRPALASQENRRAELIVSLISRAYIYCKDLQTGEIQVFNRQHSRRWPRLAGTRWRTAAGRAAPAPGPQLPAVLA